MNMKGPEGLLGLAFHAAIPPQNQLHPSTETGFSGPLCTAVPPQSWLHCGPRLLFSILCNVQLICLGFSPELAA